MGFVHSVESMGLVDGPGIRTVIFLQGCPLRCVYCHNPDTWKICDKNSEESAPKEQIHKEFNIHKSALDVNAQKGSTLSEYTPEELLSKILRFKSYFGAEGGVTFSGGEPFMQCEFLIKILKRCQKEKIHTAIETSFYTSLELIKKALPYLDLVYIDLKIFDEQKHQACTNVSSQLIKENIRYVLQSEYKDKVIIRTPLIPTMSATDENIHQIVKFLIQINPEVKYEMLNYNPLASAKYELVNLKYGLESYQMFTKQQMQHFYDVALQAGIKNLIKE